MTPERWRQVEALFEQAQGLPREAREALLTRECAGDEDLYDEVQSLLDEADSQDARLDAGAQSRSGLLGSAGDASTMIEGADFGPYVIGRLLGAGGMGEVYLAQDRRLRRKVALKLLAPWLKPDAGMMRRFNKEALAASALNHPNIPVVFETGEIDGRRFIASEYVDGAPLTERLKDGPLPWRQAADIARKVAEALKVAHQAGIIHRDIKPGNILVCADGRVKLVDFGIAKFGISVSGNTTDETQVTRVGMVLGTPGYMPPEQADGLPVDLRSDLWSLAAVLHQMLTGQRLVQGRVPTARPKAVPRPLWVLLERGLQVEPVRRYQTADEFILALQAAERRARWMAFAPWWGGAALVVVTTGGYALLKVLAPMLGLAATPPSLLVLRFEAPASDAQTEYLGAGIQGEILEHLARISGLQVLAPQVSASLPTRPSNLAELGRRYQVAHVLEGSVRVESDRVHVEARLLDTAHGRELWSDTYDRERRDIFDLERDIAERVAARLTAPVLPAERAAIEQADTRNPDAHAAFLRGRFFRARVDRESLEKAMASYEEALLLDPGYAAASAGLAIAAFKLAAITNDAGLPALKARARAAAERAVRLAPNQSEPHVALGWVFLVWDWDFAAAEHEFHQAVDLAPGSAPEKNALGSLASMLGQFERGARLLEAARRLDPVTPAYARNLANARLAQGRDRDAERLLREALELEPKSPVCHARLAMLALQRRDLDTALREAQLEPDASLQAYAMALIAQAKGPKPEAEAVLARFTRSYQEDSPFRVACLHAFRGEKDAAFDWLERAYQIRDEELIDVMSVPFLAELRQDPRFNTLRTRLGIPAPVA